MGYKIGSDFQASIDHRSKVTVFCFKSCMFVLSLGRIGHCPAYPCKLD